METMQKPSRTGRNSQEEMIMHNCSLSTRDDSHPTVTLAKQDEFLLSLEQINASFSRQSRIMFAGTVAFYMAFLVFAIFHQTYAPWELPCHAYFKNEVESGSIIAAEVVAILVCLMDIAGLMHNSRRHRLWFWCSLLPGTLLAIFWLYHILRLAELRMDMLCLIMRVWSFPVMPLCSTAVCLHADDILDKSPEGIRKLRAHKGP